MANTYLTRTQGTPTNAKKWTISFWMKGKLTDGNFYAIFGCDFDNGDSYFGVGSGGQGRNEIGLLEYHTGATNYGQGYTDASLRDSSGWYHIVFAYDSTQSTASDRGKTYINGVQQTNTYSTNIPQNHDSKFNSSGVGIRVGNRSAGGGSANYDGCLSHFNFIDGTAYQASDFGEYDANGVWKIIVEPSVTYGTNGFFILKDGNSVTDQSGNSNNFTVGGGTLTNTEDCPSNVFATLNPLQRNATTANNNTLSIGNTRQTTMSIAGVYTPSPSTLGMTSGKIYAEMKVNTMPANCFVGIDGDASNTVRQGINFGSSPYGYAYAQWGGKYHDDVSVAGAGATFGAGDIIGIAVDLDNNKIYFSKNGTWQNSGDPTSGATGTGAFYTIEAASSTTEGAYFFESSNNDADGNAIFDWNFGNGYFGTTAVASAGTNASGNGIFEYDVPTGYTALSTKGLNE